MANNIGYTFGSKPDYTVGNIVLTAGSKNFTVTNGANLQTANILSGYTIFHPNGKILAIDTIVSATSGTLRYDCPSDCGGTIATMIRYQSEGSSLSAAVRDLLSGINSGLLSSISSLSMTEGKMIVGDATAGTVKLVDMGRLENIRALTLSANQIIVGNGGNAVKAVTLNSDNIPQGTDNQYVTAAQKSKLDNIFTTANTWTANQTFGTATIQSNILLTGAQINQVRFTGFDGTKDGGMFNWSPLTNTGPVVTFNYIAGGGLGVWIAGGGSVLSITPTSTTIRSNLTVTGTLTTANATVSGTLTTANATVSGTLNASAANLTNLFVGQISFYPAINAPAGWLKANGALVSRTTYPLLWAYAQASGALVSEADWNNGRQGCFSTGNTTSNFRLPETRGEFIRGLDDGRGIDSGRTIGSAQGDAIRNITGSYNAPRNIGFVKASDYSGPFYPTGVWNAYGMETTNTEGGFVALGFDASRTVPTASENRPRNIALLGCIRYQ